MSTAQDTIDARRAKQIEEEFEAERPAREIGPLLSKVLALALILFAIGLVGFLTRRNMILMFLSTELMFQAAALAFVAFGRMWMDLSGQLMVIFILTVAAAEAALALGLVVLLYRRKETLSNEAWSELKE